MSSLLDAMAETFSADGFIPRRVCGFWPDWLVWEHVVGNALVWIAYVAIPVLIWRLGRRRPDWSPFVGVMRAFALFIGFCGLGHFLDMLAFFHPLYRLSGHVLVATGLVSFWTVGAVCRAWPAFVAMKGPTELERNIAERTRELAATNADLRASEARFRQLADAMPQIVWEARPDGCLDYHNERWYEYTGFSREAGGDESWGLLLHPDDQPRFRDTWRRSVAKGEPFQAELRFRDRTTEAYRWHLSRALPVRGRLGEVVRWVGTSTDIDIQKRAEEAVSEAGRTIAGILESITDASCAVDREWRLTYVNSQWEQIQGLRRGDVVGRVYWDVFPEARGTVVEETLRRVARENKPDSFELSSRGADRWMEVRAYPTADGISTYIHDISDRKRAEERLRESEARFRLLTEGLPQLVWTCLPDGQCDYLSRQWIEYTGIPEADQLGTGWIESVHPDDRDRTFACWMAAAADVDDYDIEYRIRRSDGSYRWFKTRGRPLRDDAGRIVKWFGTSTDVHDGRLQAEALRESEDRRRRALSVARLGNWELDPRTGRITYQDGLPILYGRPDDRPFADLAEYLSIVHPDDRAAFVRAARAARSPGVPFEVEYRVVHPDGSARWLSSLGATVVEAAGGEPARMVGVNIDITERKEADRQIRRLNETLERRVAERTAELASALDSAEAATRAKGDFLANMSHEIRTPMSGVLGMTDLLLDTPLNDLQRDYTRTIRSSGEALLSVINDILDFSKIEAGKMAIDIEEFDLLPLMEEVAELLAPKAQQKGLEINCRVDPGLPARLEGDPTRVRQVLTNLAGNAVKFTDRGEVSLEAMLLGESDGRATVRIEVRDTGIGIPEDRQGDVFESFTQVEGGRDRKQGGTGLGLAICRRLVGLMDGRLGLESHPGRGSVFWFELPMALVPGARPAPRPHLDGARVLVVDDLETSRAIARETLLSRGCRPESAGSGAAAIEILLGSADDPFRLVLIDDDMPGMDGVETARQVRAAPGLGQVPLVLLASLGKPRAGEGRDLGPFLGTLTKPVRRSQLDAMLDRALSPPGPGTTRHREPASAEPLRLDRPIRILMAEDNEVNRMVATGMAERLGCVVDSVRDGREAVEALDHGLHDLILMDVQMPVMDGFAATAAIRELERPLGLRIPIIAMTAHAMEGDRERCVAADMDDYITKPVRPGPFREALLAWSGKVRRAAPGGRSATRSFSPEVLRECCGDDPRVAREVVELLLGETPGRLKLLRAAIDAGDNPGASREAHFLKGGLASIGADDLAASCQALIARAEQGDPDGPPLDPRPILDRWEQLRRELIAYLASHRDLVEQ